jgi:DNA modification methylase
VSRIETIGDCTLYLGDCLEILPTLGTVDAVVTDPPYEMVMQNNFGATTLSTRLGEIRKFKTIYARGALGFVAIDEIRDQAAQAMVNICEGWAIIFCIAEGVRAWRDSLQAAGAKYKRAMVWIKPDAMPQFNGQGPSVGHEMMVTAWCGRGYSRWNGGGKPGNFTCNKNRSGEHPTQKPLPLIMELVALFSDPATLVCDPFMGSGTAGVACVKTGRRFVGVEKNQIYFDIACRRIADAYKQYDLFIPPPLKIKQESLL